MPETTIEQRVERLERDASPVVATDALRRDLRKLRGKVGELTGWLQHVDDELSHLKDGFKRNPHHESMDWSVDRE